MKSKNVFALYGTANAGKSTTLRKLYELLTKAYPAAHIQIIHPVGVDFTVIIEIDGVLIGIESQGDPGSRLAVSIELFAKRGCFVIVCATRTRGGTVAIVEALKPEFAITWHRKVAGEEDDKMAQTILSQIRDALKEA
jgi:hypothetical protein